MLRHMRTTINLPDGLSEEAKRHAQERGCTFTALVVAALHKVLREPDNESPTASLSRHGGAGGTLLVDLSDRSAVADALDADGVR